MKSYILCDVLQVSFVSSRGFSGFVKNPAAGSNSSPVFLMTVKFFCRLKILPSIFLSQARRLEER